MSCDTIIRDDAEFKCALINHPSYIGKYHSSKYASAYLRKSMKSLFQYVLWEKESVSNPPEPGYLKSFCISFTTFFTKNPSLPVEFHFLIYYTNDSMRFRKLSAVDISCASKVSLYNYVTLNTRSRTAALKISSYNNLYTLNDVVKILEIREEMELRLFHQRSNQLTTMPGCVKITLKPFNRFQTSCSVTCFSFEKTHTYNCKQLKNMNCDALKLQSPWTLEKMSAFILRNTQQDISALPGYMQFVVLSTRVQYTQQVFLGL